MVEMIRKAKGYVKPVEKLFLAKLVNIAACLSNNYHNKTT